MNNMDAYSSDLVYQAIITLFNGNNPKDQEKANQWLEEFQKSIFSWTIADELLHQKRDLHASYFAAQTMRNKIQNSFNELPSNTYESLRDSLISHISQTDERTDSRIITQLSLAIADLALLMATWKNPIQDLLDILSPQPLAVMPLLEILKVLPEEIDSRYLRLGANRREDVRKEMDVSAPNVLKFLCMCTQRIDLDRERLLNSTLRCFSSWLAIHAFTAQHFYDNTIAQQSFVLLSQHETAGKMHDNATEVVCSLLCSIGSNNNHYGSDPQLDLQIFNAVCMLENAYHLSVAHEDSDKAMNYCRIFTSLCDAFFYDMLAEDKMPHYCIKGLDLVLLCVGHFDYEVAEITFNLWYRLSEELFQRNNDKLTAHFKPHIERLIGAVYRHSQMDSDQEGLIDEHSGFNDFRRKVSDLIKDVAFIVGSGACFKQMFLTLQTPTTTWESTEAALFIMQNVAKNILPEENEIIPKVVEAILSLPENTHIAVRYTSILLLGELCDWIENHPESLQAVLNFLLYALQQKNGLASAAAIALTSICTACRQKMVCHISGLVEIARCLDSFEISNDVAIGLLKGISSILTRLPRVQLEPAFREIIAFQLQPLARMVENNIVTSIQKGERTDPVYWIDRTCSLIRHTNPDIPDSEPHPTVQILTDAWPLLSGVLNKYQTDLRIMERTCRLIRYGIRMVHKQAVILVEPLIKQMIALYAAHHHSCFLYLGSVLVDEYAKIDECIPGLLEMLQAFIEPTFNMLQVENGLRNNPDTVEDFFRLVTRYLDCCPLQLLRSALITAIFQCALIACSLDHREANSSVMKFFINLFVCGRSNNYRFAECRPLVNDIATQNGKELVVNLIHASVFSLHSYMLPDVAEVLTELKQVITPLQMEEFLRSALEALPKKNSGGYVTATQQQLEDFSNTVLRADTAKAITQALKIFTRLYR